MPILDAEIAQLPGVAAIDGSMLVIVYVVKPDGTTYPARVTLTELSAWLKAQ